MALNGGAGMSPIVEHPDVQRMLMTMKAYVQAARGICHLTGVAIDLSCHAADRGRARGGGRARRAADADRQGVLDRHRRRGRPRSACRCTAAWAIIEETGAAQFMRDARIAAIYEGANGIQAIDLVQRKLLSRGGETVRNEIAGIRAVARPTSAARRRSIRRDGRAPCARRRRRSTRDANMLDGSRASSILRLRALRNIFACSAWRSAAPAWRRPAWPRRRLRRMAIGANLGASALPVSSPKSCFRSRRGYRERDRLRRRAAAGL